MENPTLGGPTMGPGLLPIIAPPAPPVSAIPSIYGAVAPYVSVMLGVVATAPLKIVQRIETRPAPNKPPVSTLKAETDVTAYVSGPLPVRSQDGSMTGVSMIAAHIRPDEVTSPIEIDNQVEFDGDLYVVTKVQRIPLTGPAVSWRIEAERGK